MNTPKFVSFGYSSSIDKKINKIILMIINNTKIPECLIDVISHYLLLKRNRNMKFCYSKKDEHDTITRNVIFHMNYYYFVSMYVESVLFNFFEMNRTMIIPNLDADVDFFYKRHSEFLINPLLFIVLFSEVFNDFRSCEIYFCSHKNHNDILNDKYLRYLKKLKRGIHSYLII